ncbi:hypothetical protein GIB67_042416 [Kingdonia uniflora]|uniref:Uncharacterized protein n=1 Tax=Kingdonia uniflora TaxID=39325 RepID=A0A7J7M863_9MAGN|nr:hypothetical protein GIB67_042416 [Kingdonia uniflora]
MAHTTVILHLKIFTWVFLLSLIYFAGFGNSSWCQNRMYRQTNPMFEQKTDRFWKFDEEFNSWVEVDLPFDLLSCVNGNCTKVGKITKTAVKKQEERSKSGSNVHKQDENSKSNIDTTAASKKSSDMVLRTRKRISLTRTSEKSIWVTGESGSIYERFWNGVQWVIVPHDLPESAGPAVSVFVINQIILALSQAGSLYQLQLTESSETIWIEITPSSESASNSEIEEDTIIKIKNGVSSYDGEKLYFSTMNGSLLELGEVETQRWIYHGRPAGGNVAIIVDAATIRPDVVFTVSSAGDLYEFDMKRKPSWMKHIWREGLVQETSLIPSTGFALHGLVGAHSLSLFLLTKVGYLVERRMHQRKWKWIVHGGPKDQYLTSITPVLQDEWSQTIFSIFLTTTIGSVIEYQLPRHPGNAQENYLQEPWVDHIHPLHAKVAVDIPGLQIYYGRILFPMDDGRLAELHLSGTGGEQLGPTRQTNMRRKSSFTYEWSVLDAPETEGWNSEYCTDERGPSNCNTGTKPATRRQTAEPQYIYLSPSTDKSTEKNNFIADGLQSNFRMRVVQPGRSFFLVIDSGLTFEFIYGENLWWWLRHEHSIAMKGVVGNYNGSIFMLDTYGNLLSRERSGNELTWTNCTDIKRGKQLFGGPPWDSIPHKATQEDALFFVSKKGRLLQFKVSFREFKWKDCGRPGRTKIASIVDQETLRANIVFVTGRNGQLYQYNKVTKLWHKHHQSRHLILSKSPGTAMRQSLSSLAGSLFLVGEDGGLVEYKWDTVDGWVWLEHGRPSKSVSLVGAPGPCLDSNKLFLIGLDGIVYLRYLHQSTWKWKNCGNPLEQKTVLDKDQTRIGAAEDSLEKKHQNLNDPNRNCDAKVASTRPIPFSKDSVIFELRDRRLAELRKVDDDTEWVWSGTIDTPTSLCHENYWNLMAS